MRILIAPDKFKGTLSAPQVIAVLAQALHQADPRVQASGVAMADGGDGTLEVALGHGYRVQSAPGVDALGRPVEARYAIRGDSAVIELAAVCGLATVLDRPQRPWQASTLGLGLVARHAIGAGATQVTIGLGGSASVDGGLGFLVGLGVRVRDRMWMPVPPGLLGVRRAVRLDMRRLDDAIRRATWRFLVDVTNPLLGPLGAAAVFGPQKGLMAEEIAVADASLEAWADLLDPRDGRRMAGEPGMGAAGGVALAGALLFGAQAVPGATWVAEQAGLRERIAACDAVVTGEGRFDRQSLMGKAPGLVLDLARALGKPVLVVAGSSELTHQQARSVGVSGLVSLADLAGSGEEAMSAPEHWLGAAAGPILAHLDGWSPPAT